MNCHHSEISRLYQITGITHYLLLYAPLVTFEFSKPFETRKVASKKQQGVSVRVDQETAAVASGNVSVNEPTTGEGLPGADWQSVKDKTDDDHLYANKFECFQQMLDKLCTKHGCEIKSKQLRKRPKLLRCKKHLLIDGNPRCMAAVEVVFGGNFSIFWK